MVRRWRGVCGVEEDARLTTEESEFEGGIQNENSTFYWNFVKWYDTFSSVQFITHFYHGADEYSFKRIGEDYGDIEIDWNGDYSDIDELSEVRQSIEIAPGKQLYVRDIWKDAEGEIA